MITVTLKRNAGGQESAVLTTPDGLKIFVHLTKIKGNQARITFDMPREVTLSRQKFYNNEVESNEQVNSRTIK